jgi:hypothetical protein
LASDISEEGVEDEGLGVGVDLPEVGDLLEDGGVVVDAFLLVALGGDAVDGSIHDLAESL